MLKISEMAKLANTTRRTLIFYDQENIFKPMYKTETGFHYYEYSQLYDLMVILGFRNLDLTLTDIKAIKDEPQEKQAPYLLEAESKISQKISELVRIQRVLNNRIESQSIIDDTNLYEPTIKHRPMITFLVFESISWLYRE